MSNNLITIILLGLLVVVVVIGALAITIYAAGQVNTGLETSYEVHLAIAQRWVAVLSEYGINTTAETQLINEAKYEASMGNYTGAIALLNKAISLSAQAMAEYLSNSTSITVSNYNTAVNSLNASVKSSLNSNGLGVMLMNSLNFMSKLATSTEGLARVLPMVGKLNATLSEALTINPSLGSSVDTARSIIGELYREVLTSVKTQNTTEASIALLKAEVLTASNLLTNVTVREKYLHLALSRWLSLAVGMANETYRNITSTLGLGTWIELSNNISTCLNAVGNLSQGLALGTVSVDQLISNYSLCLSKVKALTILANNSGQLVMGIHEVTDELSLLGYTSHSNYVNTTFNSKCLTPLIRNAELGNLSGVKIVINECRHLVSQYRERVNYVQSIINMSNYNIIKLNNTITNILSKHGVAGVAPALCWVRIYGNISSIVNSIVSSVLNGTMSGPEASSLISQYFINLTMNPQQIIAGCIGYNVTKPGDCSVRYSVSGDVVGVELGVCGSGSAVLEDVVSVRIDGDYGVVVQLVNSDVPSGLRFVLNGEAILRSGNAEYRVPMPCMISAGTPCYRVMTLIPGYDAPLKVLPGTYTVTLKLNWNAEGNGVVRFALRIVKVRADNVTKPGPSIYIPMINATSQPEAVGLGMGVASNGSVKLLLLVSNPTQANLYISGFGLGNLYCSFSNDITLGAGSQGVLEITIGTVNGSLRGTASLSTGSSLVSSQETTFTCRGFQQFSAGVNYTGYLMLSNGEELQFQVQATGTMPPQIWS